MWRCAWGCGWWGRLASKCRDTVRPLVQRYAGEEGDGSSGRKAGIVAAQTAVVEALVAPPRGEGDGEGVGVSAAYATLRDLQALVAVCALLEAQLAALQPASAALQDRDMTAAITRLQDEVQRQRQWAVTKVKAKSAQTLVVPVHTA